MSLTYLKVKTLRKMIQITMPKNDEWSKRCQLRHLIMVKNEPLVYERYPASLLTPSGVQTTPSLTKRYQTWWQKLTTRTSSTRSSSNPTLNQASTLAAIWHAKRQSWRAQGAPWRANLVNTSSRCTELSKTTADAYTTLGACSMLPRSLWRQMVQSSTSTTEMCWSRRMKRKKTTPSTLWVLTRWESSLIWSRECSRDRNSANQGFLQLFQSRHLWHKRPLKITRPSWSS